MNNQTIDKILETATADCFWVPPDVHIVDRPELSYIYSQRPSMNFNRVLRARPSQAAPHRLVAEVLKAHGDGNSQWTLNAMSDTPPMRLALQDAGYKEGALHHAYAIEVDAYDRRPPKDVQVNPVESVDDLRTLYEIRSAVFDTDLALTRRDLERELDACTGPDRRVARFVAHRNGEPAGSAGMTFFDDLQFALIWAGGVIEDHRGNGVYTALLAARAHLARRRGLHRLGLYAVENTSAPIVDAHGFERHGHLQYFEREERSHGHQHPS